MQEREVGGGEAAGGASSEPAVKHGNIPEVGSRFWIFRGARRTTIRKILSPEEATRCVLRTTHIQPLLEPLEMRRSRSCRGLSKAGVSNKAFSHAFVDAERVVGGG